MPSFTAEMALFTEPMIYFAIVNINFTEPKSLFQIFLLSSFQPIFSIFPASFPVPICLVARTLLM